ncbi:MAG TPA: cytochrome c [Candidatus Xenobia bacterium]|jgi:mono/diheme cytochrome c family protein
MKAWTLALLVLAGTLTVAAQIPQSQLPAAPTSVYRVDAWPQYPEPLAAGPGVAKVQQYCNVCHSTTYITSQPPLPEKTWAAEVKKMVNVYGAAIPPDQVEAIVSYLQSHYTPETIQANTAAKPSGADIYMARCAACHRPDQKGLPGSFPPLAGRVEPLARTTLGQRYLMHVVLFGMQGPIQSAGHSYDGAMPAWGTVLSDDDTASVLSYLSGAHFGAAEVHAARSHAMTPQQVRAERP